MLKSRRPQQYEHATALPALIVRASDQTSVATITRLWFDGCEIKSEERFALSENVEIEIGGMGKIRGRVASASKEGALIRFIEECPV